MIRTYARRLRNQASKAEQVLWYYLRRKQLQGFKFRRQHVIDRFIVDFVCLPKRLIVELDGGQHATQTGYDAYRTRTLESKGFKVLRFWNNEVLGNTAGVLEIIAKHL